MDAGYQNREQTEIKHYAIRLYLQAAARILGSAYDIRYVDCCAGPWNAKDVDYRDTSFGIAFEVLKASRIELAKRGLQRSIECLFIEKDPKAFRELDAFSKQRDSSEIKVRAENWNFSEHIDEIVDYCSTHGAFSFILIDPKGWKLAGISQISPILKLKPAEVVINLMSSFITRFVNDPATNLSDLLGADFPELRKLAGTELEFAVVRKYCDLIKREGQFSYVCARPVMKPDSDAFNFYLIYATRHLKGVKVFKSVEKRTEEQTHVVRADLQSRVRQERTGNFDLFEAQVLYRERKYQELAEENRNRAKKLVWKLLTASNEVSYDACWAEALQFSAVYHTDLREWLTEWENSGKVLVTGRKKPNELLKPGCGQGLHLIKHSQ